MENPLLQKTKSKIWNLRRHWRYLIHRPRRVLFDHLPKCAGTTVKEILLRHYPQKYIYELDGRAPLESIESFKALPTKERMAFRFLCGHRADKLVGLVHPDTFFTTVFRDPVDRLASHYYFAKSQRSHYLYSRINEESISLEQYTKMDLSNELSNWYVSRFSGLSGEQASTDPEKALDLAVQTVIGRYALIGFQDDMAGYLKALARSCKLNSVETNLHENVTMNKKEVTEEERAAIIETNALDIQFYNRIRGSHPSLKS